MQFEFLFPPRRKRLEPDRDHWLLVGNRSVRLHLARHRRARRYVLRLCPDGAARVTIPRGGTIEEATRFARGNVPWLEKQFLRQARQPLEPRSWCLGCHVLFRGEKLRLTQDHDAPSGSIRFGDQIVRVTDPADDLRPAIERHLWKLAARELPPRVVELAAAHQFVTRQVSVRNQRSRWGSCSRRGTISLNWRLIQAPPSVRDYIILHELAHLKEMNHSPRFWREVTRLCPDFQTAEKWLRAHGALLR